MVEGFWQTALPALGKYDAVFFDDFPVSHVVGVVVVVIVIVVGFMSLASFFVCRFNFLVGFYSTSRGGWIAPTNARAALDRTYTCASRPNHDGTAAENSSRRQGSTGNFDRRQCPMRFTPFSYRAHVSWKNYLETPWDTA